MPLGFMAARYLKAVRSKGRSSLVLRSHRSSAPWLFTWDGRAPEVRPDFISASSTQGFISTLPTCTSESLFCSLEHFRYPSSLKSAAVDFLIKLWIQTCSESFDARELHKIIRDSYVLNGSGHVYVQIRVRKSVYTPCIKVKTNQVVWSVQFQQLWALLEPKYLTILIVYILYRTCWEHQSCKNSCRWNIYR